MIFTDRHSHIIGNTDDAKLPGAYFYGDDVDEIPGVEDVELPGVYPGMELEAQDMDVEVQALGEHPAP